MIARNLLPVWLFLGLALCLANPAAIAQAVDTPATSKARPVLKEGDESTAVEALQRLLNARLDPSPELGIDGDFGPATRTALERFQRSKKLPPTGTTDTRTWDALGPPLPVTPEPPAPDEVNAEPLAKGPADSLDGPPFVTCKAWIVVDGMTGARIGGHHDAESLDMASTTKIMTALVVLRLAAKTPGALDQSLTFSERADKTSGSTSGVHAGERLPVRELMYGLLLPSGNDASVALGEHFGKTLVNDKEVDPLRKFIAEMNRQAAEMGLNASHFENTHGLTAPGHHTSARDLAKLARLALADPLFATFVSTARHGSVVVDEDGHKRNVVWENTNRLLSTEGYDGVKTGTTTAAGMCLVASGHRGSNHLIVVVLGATSSEGRYAEARNLFRWGWHELANAGH